ncbi:hypothetical protein [Microbacterium sp.]|uniref:hypothetical protein n=1 Tax=Microbacterium sp. TaxID=51671 RepID=UPI0039E68FF1
MWLSIIALVVAVSLVVPYRATTGAAMLAPVVGALIAVAGIVLAVRQRRRPGAALAFALVAVLLDVVLSIVFIAGMISATSINRVELLGQGPQGITATIHGESGTDTFVWDSTGRATLTTKEDWAEITVTAPEDADGMTVSCQIVWNGDVVVDETSDNGTVRCRFDGR